MASDGTGASVAVIVVSDRRQSDVFDELDWAAKRSKTMMRVFITPCGKREEVVPRCAGRCDRVAGGKRRRWRGVGAVTVWLAGGW